MHALRAIGHRGVSREAMRPFAILGQRARAALLFASLLGLSGGTHATVISVNTGDDPAAPIAQICSLRQAIQAANTDTAVGGCAAGAGTDVIKITVPKVQLALAGADEDGNKTGDLDITSNMIIEGSSGAGIAGALPGVVTIDAGSLDRVFDIHKGQVALVLLILQSGDASHSSAPDGGAIRVQSDLGAATLLTQFVEIQTSVARNGGGIYVDAASVLRALATTIHGNWAQLVGGGGGLGAGIYTRGPNTELRNVTLTDNRAETRGGGIAIGGIALGGTTTAKVLINNSTIALNRASNGGATASGGGIATIGVTAVDISNSIVVDNQADALAPCSGTLATARFNLLPAAFGCNVSGASDGNLAYDGVGLTALWNYGGIVPTMHPRYASLAHDGRQNTDPAQAPCESKDARGFPRPAEGACDLGAVETQNDFLINDYADAHDANVGDGVCATSTNTCTLRAAIEELGAQYSSAPHTRTLLVPGGTHTLQYGSIAVKFPLVLLGTSSRVSIVQRDPGGFPSDLLSIYSGDGAAALIELTLTGGYQLVDPIIPGGPGGGIWVNARDLLIYGSEITHNQSPTGGGGLYADLGTRKMLIDHSTFADNYTIHINSTLPRGGGAWFNSGSVNIVNSTFAQNTTHHGGGGIYVAGGKVVLSNATIANNQSYDAAAGGGLLVAYAAQVGIANSVLSGNHMSTTVPDDCAGSILIAAHSLIQANNSCSFLVQQALITGADPLLGALVWEGGGPNGGLPRDMPFAANSPLLDAGDPKGCLPAGMTKTAIPLARDEHENQRPSGFACDIGAYERAGGI